MSAHTEGEWRIGDAGQTVFGPQNGSPAPEVIAVLGRKNWRGNGPVIRGASEALPANEPGRVVLLIPRINALVRQMEGRQV